MLARHFLPVLADKLATFRVVHLGGTRQVSKTTLVRDLLPPSGGSHVTLDDHAVLLRARDDAAGLLAVKSAVDTDQRRGQFLLTGSAGSFSNGRGIETLAGRVGRAVLWPLSQGEQCHVEEMFLDRLADPPLWPTPRRPSIERRSVHWWSERQVPSSGVSFACWRRVAVGNW